MGSRGITIFSDFLRNLRIGDLENYTYRMLTPFLMALSKFFLHLPINVQDVDNLVLLFSDRSETREIHDLVL